MWTPQRFCCDWVVAWDRGETISFRGSHEFLYFFFLEGSTWKVFGGTGRDKDGATNFDL